MAHYSIGPFPTRVIFRPSQGPFILGHISSIWLLTARYCHFLLVGQIQPSRPICGPLIRWAIFMSKNPLGRFYRVIKYDLLTAHYGP